MHWQSYKLSMRNLNLFRIWQILIILISLFMIQCVSPAEKFLEADKQALRNIQLLLDQEVNYANAITQMDSSGAILALDSMNQILRSYADFLNQNQPPKEDSLYFNQINGLMEYLQILADSLYPKVMQLVFLPDKEFTFRENDILAETLYLADSMKGSKLEKVKIYREVILEKYFNQSERVKR